MSDYASLIDLHLTVPLVHGRRRFAAPPTLPRRSSLALPLSGSPRDPGRAAARYGGDAGEPGRLRTPRSDPGVRIAV